MEAVTEPLTQGGFSLELSQDQRDVRDWVQASRRTSSAPPRPSGTSARRRPGR